MARRSGRNGRIYIDMSSGANGSASPISTLQTWSISQTRDRVETTCLGDTSKQYIMGLGDATGSFAGLIDLGVVNFARIADGVARKLYIYPDRSNHEGVYWFTTAVMDASYDSGVNDLVKSSVNWAAASDLNVVGDI
jgi:hypothetical protein